MGGGWDSLNDRQRAYLRALYDCDQAKEAERRQCAVQGFYDRTPASEWRWVLYGPVAPPSALYSALRRVGLVDPGTGATWQALEERGLCRCRYPRDAFGVQLLEVQITPVGRRAVRAATGEARSKQPPKGQLRERQWAALARLYATGEAGVLSEEMMYGFDWTRTLLRLREYKPQPLMEEFNDPEIHIIVRMRLTPFGRDYYRREWARYSGLYPAVEAVRPTEDTPVGL